MKTYYVLCINGPAGTQWWVIRTTDGHYDNAVLSEQRMALHCRVLEQLGYRQCAA